MNKNLYEPKIIVNQKYRRTENNNEPKRNQILKIIMIEKKETKKKNERIMGEPYTKVMNRMKNGK